MKIRTSNILLTAGLAAIVSVLVSAATLVIIGQNNSGSRVLADHGDTDDPPWVNPDGTMNKDLIPDRLPLYGNNSVILGYVEVDKDPNDDPDPGDPGFEEWNKSRRIVYVSETGDEVAGTIRFDGPGGSRAWQPVSVNEDAPGGEQPPHSGP